MQFDDISIVLFSTLPSKCAYLGDELASMEYLYIQNCPFELNDLLVQKGYRRFGKYFSRPQCKDCKQCLSLRIDAQNFHFSKSVRRIFKKNENKTRILIQKPSINEERLELYNKYHTHMQQKRGWKHNDIKPQSYYEYYVNGQGNFGLEFLYFYDDKLIGVDLVDKLKDGLSSIYFFYDPDFAYLNLGKYSIYQQILYAQRQKQRWIYLGYYVKNCQSLNYKENFKPYEILQNNPSLDQKAIWG